MEEWKERALILRLGHFRERDIWLRLLLPSRGIYTVFAFGGAVSRRRFCGCLDILNEIDCRIKVNSRAGYLNLEEATLRSAPLGLRNNRRNAGMAVNCLSFAEAIEINQESSAECYDIIRNLCAHLESAALASWLLPHFFRLRLAAATGYSPNLELCAQCGSPIDKWGYFLVNEGSCLCETCSASRSFLEKRRGLMLASETLGLLPRILETMPGEWQNLDFTDQAGRQAVRAIDGFIHFHLGIVWENGAFRRG